MKKIIIFIVAFIIGLSGNIVNIQAYGKVYYTKEIPEKMEEITTIRFIDESHFIVLEGKISNNYKFTYLDSTGLTDLYPLPFEGRK